MTKEEAQKIAEKAASKWWAELMVNAENRVRALLDRHFQEIVMSGLGFRESFGRWEMDHYADNVVSQEIRRLTEHHALSMIKDSLKLPIVVDKKQIAGFHKYYLDKLEQRLAELITEQAREDAEKEFKAMVKG